MQNTQTGRQVVETKNIWVNLKQFYKQTLSPELVHEMNNLGRDIYEAGNNPRVLHKDSLEKVLDNHIILEKNKSGLYDIVSPNHQQNRILFTLFKPLVIFFLTGLLLGIVFNGSFAAVISFVIGTLFLSIFLGYAAGEKVIKYFSLQKHKSLLKTSLYLLIFLIINMSLTELFDIDFATKPKDVIYYIDLGIGFLLLITLVIFTKKIIQNFFFLLFRKKSNTLLSIASSKEIKELEEQYFNYSSRALDKSGFDIAVWLHIEENKKLIVSLPELKTDSQETIMVSKSDIDFEKLLHKIIYRTKEEDLISFQETFLKNIYPLTYSTNKNFIHIGNLPVDEEKLATLVTEKPL